MRILLLASLALASTLGAQSRLAVSATPTVVIGNDETDDATTFGRAVSATRLPNGNIIVGDVAKVSLLMFSPQGKLLNKAAPEGAGPGEIKYLADFMRCGNGIITRDIGNGRYSEFSFDLKHKRTVPLPKTQGYQTRCNKSGKLFNYGWEAVKEFKPGVFRTDVPFWFSTLEDGTVRSIGEFPGSERWGFETGTRPLPLGKQAVIAIGSDRAYIGTADRYEVKVVDFAGKETGVIRDASPPVAVTKADVDAAIDFEVGGKGEEVRKRIAASYATMQLPSNLPAYKAFVIDARDLLWVQDYPRAQLKTVRWSVFSADGKLVGRVQLPTDLDVYEIGTDYVLGRFTDREASIPLIHQYKLTR